MNDSIYKVEKLVHGGLGLVRGEEGVLFVPLVIPGEMVRIGGVRREGRRRIAETVEIVGPSPERVAAPCPLFGRCGGCQLQHVSYTAQLRFKREIVGEALGRIAGVEAEVAPMLPAASPWHYRARIKLQARSGRAGFFAERSKEFLPVERCYIARNEINDLLPTLGGLARVKGTRTVELMLKPDGVAAIASGRGLKVYRRVSGGWAPDAAQRVAFTQVNPERNLALMDLVAELAGLGPCAAAIDLYAGAGNLTIPLLGSCSQVTAVDNDPSAAELGRQRVGQENAGRVRFVNMNAEDFLAGLQEIDRPDLVVLDPPRSGARPAISCIIRLAPPRIIYVSCDPATLARDLKDLVRAGYRLSSITPLDMFPQTAHIETVSLIEREK